MTYLTGSSLIQQIDQLGLLRIYTDECDPVFESVNQAAVSSAQKLLIDHGYMFVESDMSEPEVYAMKFCAPGDDSPWFVELRYIGWGYAQPLLALCYLDNGRLIQFTMPYRSFVKTIDSDDARALVSNLIRVVGDDVAFAWVPLLTGTKLAHF